MDTRLDEWAPTGPNFRLTHSSRFPSTRGFLMSTYPRPKVILSANKSPFKQKAMIQPLFLLLIVLTTFAASAQQQAKDAPAQQPAPHPGNYSSDSFRLQIPGRRISLYAFCTPYHEGRAVYFRKDQDEAIHRLNYQNLSVALADNPASMQQLRIAHTNSYLAIGLFAGGMGLTAAGCIITDIHDHTLTNAYNHASAKWQAQSLINPNTPMPTPPNLTLSPLIYIGLASTISCVIPINGRVKHTQKAIDTYNGIN
jgi:hypothetical protein